MSATLKPAIPQALATADDEDIVAYVRQILDLRPRDHAPRAPLALQPFVGPNDLAGLRLVGDCPGRCSSGGVVVEEHDGSTRGAPCPNCAAMRQQADRFTAAGFPPWIHELRGKWREGLNDAPAIDMATTLARRLQLRIETGRLWYGGAGRGKSYRAGSVALAALDLGMSVRWVDWRDTLATLRDRFREDQPIGDFTERMSRCGLLVVDEVKGKATEFTSEIAEVVMGRRAETKRALLVTTNFEPERARAYLGDRVWSRLAEACTLTEVDGVDLRAPVEATHA